jgi:hypothetical protein
MMRRKNDHILEAYDKTQVVDKKLVDKVSLWMLRILMKLGASKKFIDKSNYLSDDSIAYFLDLGRFVDMDDDAYKRSDVMDILKENHI